jgi:hypothetical protein
MLKWLETLPISEWIATSDLGYPLLLSVHSMGMAIVVGIMVMLDVRLLGSAKAIPIGMFERLVPLAWGGFALNLVSGVLLFMSMAPRLAINWPFLCKLATILVAGLISWLLWKSIRRDADGRSLDGLVGVSASGEAEGAEVLSVSPRTRSLAILSIAAWALAILFGRLIAYVLDALMLSGDF